MAKSQLIELKKELRKYADQEKAKFFPQFFKTGKGQYGEGDQFIGVTVPNTRSVAKRFPNLPLPDLKVLLLSKIHEERLLALLILVAQYKKSDRSGKESIYHFYLRNLSRVNNWDLVDSSAKDIVGSHLADKDRKILYRLVRSKSLWERRVAIISTFYFIRMGDFTDTLKISEYLLKDQEDLLHKAAGWMLREVGNRDASTLIRFLNRNGSRMPRTMLRYAIEKFPEKVRKKYLRSTKDLSESEKVNRR